LVKHLALTFTV